MVYTFAEHCLDTERRELRNGDRLVGLEPQVFDLLHYLVQHRDRVVTKEQLFNAIWTEKIVSESTLSSRIAAARRAIGDDGDGQRLIRTFSRKGFRFVADVREQVPSGVAGTAAQGSGTGAAPAATTRVAPSAERRQLTIMNCRIADSPEPTAALDPEDLSTAVAARWRSVAEIIKAHGGFVAHCIGESLVAYFGFPRTQEHDVERAVRAALAVVDRSRELEAGSSGEPLRIAVGIATGLVVMDEPTAGTTTAPQALGETPFAAARMVDLCAPCAVVIAASTRVHLGNLFEYRALEADRGGEGRADAFVVLGDGATPNRFEALRAGGTRRIGRDEELALLERRWQQAGGGEGRVVLVSGEPGIGKSHLAAAFQETLRHQPLGCLRYFCSPHGTQSALHPVIALLGELAGIRRGDTAPVKLAKLERLASAHFDGARNSVTLLADLLAVPSADVYAPLALSAQRRKELLLELFVAQVARLAAHQPVLVIVEDAHWIDPTTAEFLDVLVERVRHLRVLLLITHRPEFDPPWLGQSHVTSLLLNRLGQRESADLVRQVAGERNLSPALLQRIVSQADGIPLFLEEVTKAVLEGGDPGGQQGSAVADGASGLPVPATVRTSLAARLERLAEARTLMQTCSALGREFSYAMVRSVTRLPDSDLGLRLGQLVASGLVHQRGVVPDAVFAFKHALVQDAAYETMVRGQRVQLHRRIVEVFENEFADQQALHPEVFAFHCAEAGHWDKAIDARIRAARLARARSAGIEAQAHVEAGMQMLKRVADDGERRQLEGRVQVALGEALAMTQGFASPDVMKALSTARKLLDETIHPLESVGALCGMFNYHMIRSESPACLALARPYLRKRLDTPIATLVSYLAGTAHLHLGNFQSSIAHLESALASYDEDACRSISFIPGYHLRSFVMIWLGLGRLYVGHFERAHEAITDAVNDARSRSHPFTLVSALLARARYCQHTLDLDGAVEATDEGASIAQEQRSPYHVSRAGILRALNICMRGRPDEGIVLMEQALAAHHATGANFLSSYNLSRLAQAHAQAGRLDRASELAERASGEVERSGERWWRAEAWRIKGEILMMSSAANNAEAERCFERALADARARKASLWELQAAQSLATLWAATGRRPQAAALLTAVLASFREGLATRVLVAAKEALRGIG